MDESTETEEDEAEMIPGDDHISSIDEVSEDEIIQQENLISDISDTLMSGSEVQEVLQINPETNDIVDRQRHEDAAQQIILEDRKRERLEETKNNETTIRKRKSNRITKAKTFKDSCATQKSYQIERRLSCIAICRDCWN